MHDIRQKYNGVKNKVEENVFDPYLLKYIKRPIIDEDKLLILVSMMDLLNLPYHEIENKAISTMLIQIALDTHENIMKSSEDKNRQLVVLAGDYYSGLYYKLLAHSEDILMIKAISNGVKEINERKISVYHSDFLGIDKLMESIMLIESSLLVKLTEYFKVEYWNNLITNLLLFNRIQNEKNLYSSKKDSVLFEGMKNILYPIKEFSLSDLSPEQHDQLLNVCDDYLEVSKQNIKQELLKLPNLNKLLKKRIDSLINQHQPYAKTFVEEG